MDCAVERSSSDGEVDTAAVSKNVEAIGSIIKKWIKESQRESSDHTINRDDYHLVLDFLDKMVIIDDQLEDVINLLNEN